MKKIVNPCEHCQSEKHDIKTCWCQKTKAGRMWLEGLLEGWRTA